MPHLIRACNQSAAPDNRTPLDTQPPFFPLSASQTDVCLVSLVSLDSPKSPHCPTVSKLSLGHAYPQDGEHRQEMYLKKGATGL